MNPRSLQLRVMRELRVLAVASLVGAMLEAVAPWPVQANEADVIAVHLECRDLVCDFDVTLAHADEGWNHYADAWEVLSENGEVLAKRVLRHPHVDEQPFTRSLTGVALPEGTTRVTVRARDKKHGYGGAELSVEVPPAKPGREGAGGASRRVLPTPGTGD